MKFIGGVGSNDVQHALWLTESKQTNETMYYFM